VIVLVAIVDIVELCLLACTWWCVFDTHIGDETEHTPIGDVGLVILNINSIDLTCVQRLTYQHLVVLLILTL
jgi:hypothetical protein